MTTNNQKLNESGVLKSSSNGFYVALAYGMLFVPLMLVTGKGLTINVLAIPALVLVLVARITEYFVTRGGKKDILQWILVGAFVTAALTAIGMTFILHLTYTISRKNKNKDDSINIKKLCLQLTFPRCVVI